MNIITFVLLFLSLPATCFTLIILFRVYKLKVFENKNKNNTLITEKIKSSDHLIIKIKELIQINETQEFIVFGTGEECKLIYYVKNN